MAAVRCRGRSWRSFQASGRGTLKAARALREHFQRLAPASGPNVYRRHVAVGLFVAIAYFSAARLGLHLLTELEGVAVFWPASGIAAGVLIALGRGMRAPVAIGVVVATVAANLLGDRNLWSSICASLCNAGEALLAAWLIERWFGQPFRLDDLHRVLGFLAAATLACAAAAIGGAAHDGPIPQPGPPAEHLAGLVPVGRTGHRHGGAAGHRTGSTGA